jgi:hypothetical protein
MPIVKARLTLYKDGKATGIYVPCRFNTYSCEAYLTQLTPPIKANNEEWVVSFKFKDYSFKTHLTQLTPPTTASDEDWIISFKFDYNNWRKASHK